MTRIVVGLNRMGDLAMRGVALGGRRVRKFYFCVLTVLLALCFTSILLVPLCVDRAFATIALNWTAPTTNTDGSSLDDLQGYKVYYGSGSPCNFTNTLDIGNVTPPSYTLSLPNGTYCFAITAYDTDGYESDYSNTVYKTEGPADTTAPTVTAFTIPGTSASLTVSVTSFTATDDTGVTGYMVNESDTVPSAAVSGWSATAVTSYTFATDGSKTLYAWAKDAAGNVSASSSASVTITPADTIAPTVTAFAVATPATSLNVTISIFTASDNVAVTAYMVNESSTKPLPTAAGWSETAPTSYTFASTVNKRLYAWAKDAAGNVSASKRTSVTFSTTCSNPKFKIGEGAMFNYPSIQAAYDGLSTGEVLEIQAAAFSGNLNLQQDISVTLDGGYLCDFSTNPEQTEIHGTLTISDGCVTVGNIIIQ